MKNIKKNQQGLVSILVTMMVMIVLALIVMSFAKIMRREEQQVLERQLSTQAFYAAEAGVNMAEEAVKNQGYTGDKTNCQADAAPPLDDAAMQIDGPGGSAKVTCLLIDNTPKELEYKNIDLNSRVIPIKSEGGAFKTIQISWSDSNDRSASLNSSCNYPTLPPAPNWTCSVGILRVDLVKTSGGLSRAGLLNGTFTAFLYPTSGGSDAMAFSDAAGPANQGAKVATKCSGDPLVCTMSINVASEAADSFHARIRTIYGNSTVTVSGIDVGDSNVGLKDAQILVDSTGRATDVLRRIQVRLAASRLGELTFPDYAIESQDAICKRYTVIPGQSFLDVDGAGSLNGTGTDDICNIN